MCWPTKGLWLTTLTTFPSLSVPAERRFPHTHLTNSHEKCWQLQLSCQSVVLSCKTVSQCSLLLTLTWVHLGQAEAAKEQLTTSHKHIFSPPLSLSHTHTHCSVHSLLLPWLSKAVPDPNKTQQWCSVLQACQEPQQALCLQLAERHKCYIQSQNAFVDLLDLWKQQLSQWAWLLGFSQASSELWHCGNNSLFFSFSRHLQPHSVHTYIPH